MSDKLYFFSIQKNGLALEVRKQAVAKDSSEYAVLANILNKCAGCKVAQLSGKEIGIAKKAVDWAMAEGHRELCKAAHLKAVKEIENEAKNRSQFYNSKIARIDIRSGYRARIR